MKHFYSKIIYTTYLPVTLTLTSRIKAFTEDGISITVSCHATEGNVWDYAAKKLMQRLNWDTTEVGRLTTKGGYLYFLMNNVNETTFPEKQEAIA